MAGSGRLSAGVAAAAAGFEGRVGEVEIIQATDEAVERFAVQVSNDTDPIRQPLYPQMRCVVSAQCGLTENTMRILRHTFGQVEVSE